MSFQGIEDRVEGRFRRMLRHTWLVVIAAILASIGLGAVAFHYANRPTTLIAAVGPPNSDDVRIIQAYAQHLARERAPVRLRIVVKDSAVESAAAIDRGEADIAVVRRDRSMPQAGQAVAILRKNVVVLAAPTPPEASKSQACEEIRQRGEEDREDRGPRRPAHRRDRPQRVQRQSAQHHPQAVRDPAGEGADRPTGNDGRRSGDPRQQGGRHHVGRAGGEPHHHRCGGGGHTRQGAADLPRHRRLGSDRPAQPRVRIRRKSRRVRSAARRNGRPRRSRPSGSTTTSSPARRWMKRRSASSHASC